MAQLTWRRANECALLLYLPEPVTPTYPLICRALLEHCREQYSASLRDVVPAYRSLLLVFDNPISDHEGKQICHAAQQFLHSHDPQDTPPEITRHTIEVCYDESLAPDLATLAQTHDLSTDQVIAKHSAQSYQVCCLGFIPGFAFLGYVDEAIATPRHQNPRAKVAAGSVGIAGRQTGIYPADSPGGWQIIGRCPELLYDPQQELYSRFAIGDEVRFQPISIDEFHAWQDNEASAS
ncbi:allophanate hydrolase subunit 1 [Suttonella sp. R2A3]|uniref:5-oxoprolinase subunit B family protein n=1 Tax=Suttonella sp. R2A3 TaxID=2908648 RepID=UPI001F1ECE1C|nr:allophanate hydrolase subunit 1 [Suttonella sp. R2A3]UJF24976.1 allophanate hydrolase subunit 1 [Suttonella sp. R2A3]